MKDIHYTLIVRVKNDENQEEIFDLIKKFLNSQHPKIEDNDLVYEDTTEAGY